MDYAVCSIAGTGIPGHQDGNRQFCKMNCPSGAAAPPPAPVAPAHNGVPRTPVFLAKSWGCSDACARTGVALDQHDGIWISDRQVP